MRITKPFALASGDDGAGRSAIPESLPINPHRAPERNAARGDHQ